MKFLVVFLILVGSVGALACRIPGPTVEQLQADFDQKSAKVAALEQQLHSAQALLGGLATYTAEDELKEKILELTKKLEKAEREKDSASFSLRLAQDRARVEEVFSQPDK